MALQPGALDQRVTLQRRVKTPDGAGGVTEDWSDLPIAPNVWAHVGPRSGREAMNAERVEASYRVVFSIRNRSDIDETMRILWQGRSYNIRAILRASEREIYLRIDAEKGVAQ